MFILPFSPEERVESFPWGSVSLVVSIAFFDVSVRHQSFQHEHETRGHESSSVHGEKEEEHKLKGISLGVES